MCECMCVSVCVYVCMCVCVCERERERGRNRKREKINKERNSKVFERKRQSECERVNEYVWFREKDREEVKTKALGVGER